MATQLQHAEAHIADLVKKERARDRANKTAARMDACFVAEIRNALHRDHGIDLDDAGDKAATLLRDWEAELMIKAGWKNRQQLRNYFRRTVGAYLW